MLCSASPCPRKAVGDEECWDPDDLACWDRGEHSCEVGRRSEADPAETSICRAQEWGLGQAPHFFPGFCLSR